MYKAVKPVMTCAAFAAALLLISSGAAFADLPGKHPYYLHALSDLRTARWMLEHRPGDATVSGQEDAAIQEIDAAIHEANKAAIDDGKNIHDHPAVDLPNDHPGRLHEAERLLGKVHHDIGQEEDDPTTRGLKHRIMMHVDAAHHDVHQAIEDVRHHQ